MDERRLTSNTAIHTSLELLGEGELPLACDILSKEVAASGIAAAWGLLSVLATDQAEAERCLEQVSRILFVDHREPGTKEPASGMAASEAERRVEHVVETPTYPASEPDPSAQAMLHVSQGLPDEGSLSSETPESAKPAAGGPGAPNPSAAVRSVVSDARRSTSAAILKRFVRLSGAALSGMLVLVMVGVIALLLSPRLVGAHLLVVQSQSMEPVVPMGALVVSLPVSTSEIAVGDVVTYESRDPGGGSGFVTHRVIERTGSGIDLRFVTKGDASEAADLDPVSPGAIVGRATLIIPLIGFLVVGIRTPLGFMVLIGLPALVLLLGELREIVSILRTQARSTKGAAT